MPTDKPGRATSNRTTGKPAQRVPGARIVAGGRRNAAAHTQARVQALLNSLAEERLQAHLQAASDAFAQTRPGMLVQQYRASDFHDRTKRAVTVRFRIPLATDPVPQQRRLAVVSAWAGALGLVGFAVAMPVLLDLFRPDAGWYGPVMILIGLLGVGATAGAFASIHRRRAPWIGLTIGTAALLLALLITLLR
jgi:hypothetical protein